MVETRCISQRDEFGNYHSSLQLGDDLVALVVFKENDKYDWWITPTKAYHTYQEGAESFCVEKDVDVIENWVLEALEKANWIYIREDVVSIATPEESVEIDILKPAFWDTMKRLKSAIS